MISWFDQVQVRAIPEAVLARFDPLQRAFINLNTPEDFQMAEDLARNSTR